MSFIFPLCDFLRFIRSEEVFHSRLLSERRITQPGALALLRSGGLRCPRPFRAGGLGAGSACITIRRKWEGKGPPSSPVHKVLWASLTWYLPVALLLSRPLALSGPPLLWLPRVRRKLLVLVFPSLSSPDPAPLPVSGWGLPASLLCPRCHPRHAPSPARPPPRVLPHAAQRGAGRGQEPAWG